MLHLVLPTKLLGLWIQTLLRLHLTQLYVVYKTPLRLIREQESFQPTGHSISNVQDVTLICFMKEVQMQCFDLGQFLLHSVQFLMNCSIALAVNDHQAMMSRTFLKHCLHDRQCETFQSLVFGWQIGIEVLDPLYIKSYCIVGALETFMKFSFFRCSFSLCQFGFGSSSISCIHSMIASLSVFLDINHRLFEGSHCCSN